MNYIKLERKLDEFIGSFGTETLIKYLDEFCLNNPAQDYVFIQKLLDEVLTTYCIKKGDISNMDNKKPNVVDARRQLVFFTTMNKNLGTKFITTWFNCEPRTVYKYQKEVKERLTQKQFYKDFNTENELITKNLNIHV
jgi:hypothetical protein